MGEPSDGNGKLWHSFLIIAIGDTLIIHFPFSIFH
jgi:hypothetical protein